MTHAEVRWTCVALVIGALSVGAIRAISAVTQEPARTVNDAVYSSEQAARGRKIFESKCSLCHEAERFKEVTFLNGWKGEPLSALFETIGATMPADNPGGLQPQDYADVVALILELNGYPAGPSEVAATKAAIASIRIEPLTRR